MKENEYYQSISKHKLNKLSYDKESEMFYCSMIDNDCDPINLEFTCGYNVNISSEFNYSYIALSEDDLLNILKLMRKAKKKYSNEM